MDCCRVAADVVGQVDQRAVEAPSATVVALCFGPEGMEQHHLCNSTNSIRMAVADTSVLAVLDPVNAGLRVERKLRAFQGSRICLESPLADPGLNSVQSLFIPSGGEQEVSADYVPVAVLRFQCATSCRMTYSLGDCRLGRLRIWVRRAFPSGQECLKRPSGP